MKRNLISGTTGVLSLLLIAGCMATTPAPVANVNAHALAEPISYYGDVELFDEKSTPLAVMISSDAGSDEMSFAEILKKVLNKSDISCVSSGQPCDIRINVNSDYQELTPAPKCRLSHLLSISVTVPDGTELLATWEHKTEIHQACATILKAKEKLNPQINESIKYWVKNHFRKEAGKIFKASVVRFKMSRKFIELDPVQFEKDLRIVINKLRKIDGVVDVRMIEANKESRIASFRVLTRKNISIKNEIQK